jgi:hypothetical protein
MGMEGTLPPAPTATGSKKTEKNRERTDELEQRVDATDGNMYTLDSFVSVYGGTRAKPPLQWMQSSHKKPTTLKHARTELSGPLSSSVHCLGERQDGKASLLWVSVPIFHATRPWIR